MYVPVKIDFAALASVTLAAPAPTAAKKSTKAKAGQTVVLFAGADLALGATTRSLLGAEGEALVARAAGIAKFKGKAASIFEILAPAGMAADRLLVVGTAADDAKTASRSKDDGFSTLGGFVAGKLDRGANALVIFDPPQAPPSAEALSNFILGLKLRDYRFDLYKTKKKDDTPAAGLDVVVAVADPAAARRSAKVGEAIADGVMTARSLVNEPANILYPEEVARRAKALEKLGVEVKILDETEMHDLGMGALLGVGQGSSRESRIVIMRWRGTKPGGKEAPLAFVGKGVCFDTGGISIKPAGGMEDMKGDMAGAACVVGLIQALAGRKAKVDVIGAIGLTENMPGPNAQRPGDIVTSMSGQTIEVINTDAEGRLVLADVLWYVQKTYKPKFMVDLATLTGAILVALGQEHAGLFSNDDELSTRLLAAGLDTGEKLWRMPLGPAYDKMIDSKFADMKNTGGRHGGSITAAQFLQRYVNGTPWAHLDIAGTGMSSPSSEINQSWGSGWGVRLLDRLVADHYESEAPVATRKTANR